MITKNAKTSPMRKGIEIKEASAEGVIVCAFATLNVIDKDGDVTLPGFFGKQDVVMLPAHDWSSVPLGKGMVQEVGDKAIATLHMNLEIQAAKDWHSALMFDLKHGRPMQEYSYGFTIQPGGSSPGEFQGKQVRLLRPTPEGMPGCIVHEVSPVLVGAGEMTGTLSAKDAKEGGLKFCDEIEAALVAVDGIVTRAGSLADLRWKEGRGLSAANRERLAKIVDRLKAAGVPIESLLSKDAAVREAARREINRSLSFEAGI